SIFFFSSRRRHTRSDRDWSSDVCSSDLEGAMAGEVPTLRPKISSIELLMKRRVRHTLTPRTVRVGVLARDQASEGGQSKHSFKLLPVHTDACHQFADAGSNLGNVDIPRPV